ncbi:MAG: hypothetical protein J6B98_00270 [Bacilli bacterium]|nr:hypothetical protein [Bacilli bacterium]
MDKYVIVEIIPTTRFKNTGDIAQLCAIKCDNDIISNLNLRLELEKIQVPDILNMVNYDIDKFEYLNTSNKIINKFKKFIKDYKLIIIPNEYTLDYLSDLDNEKISICEILKIKFSDNLINDIVSSYNLNQNDEIVEIMYKAIKNMK